MQKIYNHLSFHKISNIVIPKIYHRLSTKKILIQEFIDGIPLSRVLKEMRRGSLDAVKLKKMGIDIKKIPGIMASEILREYFIDEFFHADPHPGNILLLDNDRIGIVDFGIVGESAPRRHDFMKFLLAWARTKYEKSSKTYEDIGYYFLQFAGYNIEQMMGSALPANISQKKIDDFMKILTNHIVEYGKQMEMQLLKDLEVMKIDYTTMILQFLKFSHRYQVKLPKQMAVFIRTLSIVGFLAKEMNRNFNASQTIIDFFKKYPENKLPVLDTVVTPYKRMNREEAIEKLNNWLAYLIEIDPKLYQLVNNYVAQYNLITI